MFKISDSLLCVKTTITINITNCRHESNLQTSSNATGVKNQRKILHVLTPVKLRHEVGKISEWILPVKPNNNNNNNPICKAPECQKTSVALARTKPSIYFWQSDARPSGRIGATYDDYLRLIGKHVVDFLLVLIQFFSLGVMAEALRAIIG